MSRWEIILKLDNQKIFTASGKTMVITLYKFIGLTYVKGLFCENDFNRIGRNFANKVIKR